MSKNDLLHTNVPIEIYSELLNKYEETFSI